jgi:hypothetical protein
MEMLLSLMPAGTVNALCRRRNYGLSGLATVAPRSRRHVVCIHWKDA